MGKTFFNEPVFNLHTRLRTDELMEGVVVFETTYR